MLVYGECECLFMHMLYVCVMCASCGRSQCFLLHDLHFFFFFLRKNFIQIKIIQKSTVLELIIDMIKLRNIYITHIHTYLYTYN